MERNSPRLPAIEAAEIEWRDGQPVSAGFGDVYFSRDNGLEETRHVFVHHNRLPERFSSLTRGQAFVIGETGFGTGLNFLAAWQTFLDQVPADTRLHFVSVERYPLTPEDLRRALALWPELAPLAAELIDRYPPLVAGCHRLVLNGGRVRLTLFFGDAVEALEELDFRADAWFLDGFAPACNPELWQDQVISHIPGHSRKGTTVATFTAVGRIRRALAELGFEMERVPGFGSKREMLRGRLATGPEPAGPAPASVLVVGAG
ncbi:MAG: tRNA (5-methylaminomethyl-2-thiouridine)(34)-methyltransferase MnmD, partial [Marinobacter sp.]